MKRSLAFSNLCAVLGALSLILPGGSGLAQTTVPLSVDQPEPSVKEEPPPGGCMPIGVTASGEIVFPFLCKGFIEQHKAATQSPPSGAQSTPEPAAAEGQRPPSDEQDKAADQKPAVTEETDKKPAAAQEQRPAPDGNSPGADETNSVKPSEGKISAKDSEDALPEIGRPASEPVATTPPPKAEQSKLHKRSEPREGRNGPPGCTHFRTYDRRSETYRDYSGRTRACRS